jgi:hypothetical protein
MPRHPNTVWALLFVSQKSEQAIQTFFIHEVGIHPRFIKSRLHLSIYHARRLLTGLTDYQESVEIDINPADLRFMAMAPGGENPRPEIEPGRCLIGVRLKRGSPATADVRILRSRFYPLETSSVLGLRSPSSHSRSAFGARCFQPHITLIQAGSGIDRDLTKIGNAFRLAMEEIRLDRFVVKCRSAF